MADTKKPFEEVSAEDAQAMFANAAKALGGSQGRSAGFRRVSIPVSEPVRPEPLPKEEVKVEAAVVEEAAVEERFVEPVRPAETIAPEKPQSKRKAWYLKKRKEEEEESLPISKDKLRERRAAREASEEAEVVAAAAAAPVVEELAEDEDIRIATEKAARKAWASVNAAIQDAVDRSTADLRGQLDKTRADLQAANGQVERFKSIANNTSLIAHTFLSVLKDEGVKNYQKNDVLALFTDHLDENGRKIVSRIPATVSPS